MLPVMMTVKFMPATLTVGGMLDNEATQKLWGAMRNTRDGSVSGEAWRKGHDAAVAMLRKCPRDTRVAMYGSQAHYDSPSSARMIRHYDSPR